MYKESQMANKGDILTKYKNAYPQFEAQSKNRLIELERSFNNEKQGFNTDLEQLSSRLDQIHEEHFSDIRDVFLDEERVKSELFQKYTDLNQQFLEDFNAKYALFEEQTQRENQLYENILEDFEIRRQDALDIYLKLTKRNNDAIDEDMKVHHQFLDREKHRLLSYKQRYDDLSAKLGNKMMWSIEKSKNALTILSNQLKSLDKNDMTSLNQQLLNSLSDLRGTRNDINSLFKDTTSHLNDYKDEVLSISHIKQKPYTEVHQKIIQKLIKQIRLANHNKVKYQEIIKNDLNESKKRLYPYILKASKNKQFNSLEKYIMQLETLENKANYLIDKIEHITNHNITNYQKRIKEIKIDAFTRNEEIKYAYSVPIKYIENAINIYSNYNFYFNQGFNDIDRLLTQLIDFSQSFNDLRDTELLSVKKDMGDFQSNFLNLIKQTSDKLTEILYSIDEIAFQLVTLESQSRIKISEIKKEIVNIDINGDYQKYLESLNIDFSLAEKQLNKRLKKINIAKLYTDKLSEFYQKAIDLDHESELLNLERSINLKLVDLETLNHKDYFDYLSTELDSFYHRQLNLMEIYMKMMKERLFQHFKASNYHFAKSYINFEHTGINEILSHETVFNQLLTQTDQNISLNQVQTQTFINYLKKHAKEFSTLTYLEKTRLKLYQELDEIYSEKTSRISNKVIKSYSEKKVILTDINDLSKQILSVINRQTHTLTQPNKDDGEYYRSNFYRVIYHMTGLFYSVLGFAYDYSSHQFIDQINNRHDDFIAKTADIFISFDDAYKHSKRTKHRVKMSHKYSNKFRNELFLVQSYLSEMLEKIHSTVLDQLIFEIAQTKMNINHNKNIVDQEFNVLDEKVLNYQNSIKKQTRIVNNFTIKMNRWMKDNVLKAFHQFNRFKSDKEGTINHLKQQVLKIIKKNDVLLNRYIRQVNRHVINEYAKMMNDFNDDKMLISVIKSTIDHHASIEKEFINYQTTSQINDIKKTKMLLQRQLQIMPAERHSRYAQINLDYQQAMFKHRHLLLEKYHQIEKNKFTKIPLLEKDIENEALQVHKSFKTLYQSHQLMEKKYLNFYTISNPDFSGLQKGFINDSLKISLAYDQTLGQPLKDLLDVERGIVDKTNTINTMISTKTHQKINDIDESKKISKNKQDRIINT